MIKWYMYGDSSQKEYVMFTNNAGKKASWKHNLIKSLVDSMFVYAEVVDDDEEPPMWDVSSVYRLEDLLKKLDKKWFASITVETTVEAATYDEALDLLRDSLEEGWSDELNNIDVEEV